MILRFGVWLFLLMSVPAFSQKPKPDSVSSPASGKYADAGIFKQLFWGSNYRHIWEEPVKAKVFYLQGSGFTIKKLGGGQQTRSLRLLDTKGEEWVLRTVDKEVSKVLIPPFIPKTFVLPLVQDIISASFPYAPLVVYELAKTSGIIAARPELFYVADDTALGEHRPLFANQFCFLEKREPTPDDSDTKSTQGVLKDILGENENQVIQKAVLQARLLDMLVADWDRHADQWRWDKVDTAGINYYYGIPRDRDQAFFLSNGLIIKLARLFGFKQFAGFQHDLHLESLNKKSWTFDRTFLNGLNREDWEKMVRQFQSGLTDEALENAVKKLPPEIYRIVGMDFMEKLKERRDDLGRAALRYYEHISKVVVVNGTPEDEYFYIQNKGDLLELSIVDKKTNRPIYIRNFRSPETWKIIAGGKGGNDTWLMAASTTSKIRLEIQGGKDKDEYQIKGNVRTLIIENESGSDVFELGKKVKKKLRK